MMRYIPIENKNNLLHPEYLSNISNVLYKDYEKEESEKILKYKNLQSKLISNIMKLTENSISNGVFIMNLEYFCEFRIFLEYYEIL